MKSINVCFDLDGNVADLYNSNRWLEKIRGEEPNVFTSLPYMQGIQDNENYFNAYIKELQKIGCNLMIITWLPMNASIEAQQMYTKEKLEWIEQYMPYIPKNNIYILPYGVDKHSCFKRGKLNILLDDDIENCKKWNYFSSDNVEFKAYQTNDNIVEKLKEIIVTL